MIQPTLRGAERPHGGAESGAGWPTQPRAMADFFEWIVVRWMRQVDDEQLLNQITRVDPLLIDLSSYERRQLTNIFITIKV